VVDEAQFQLYELSEAGQESYSRRAQVASIDAKDLKFREPGQLKEIGIGHRDLEKVDV